MNFKKLFGARPPYQISTLENGLTILTMKEGKRFFPKAYMGLTVSSGWQQELPGERGHAHAIEHAFCAREKKHKETIVKLRGDNPKQTLYHQTTHGYTFSQFHNENVDKIINILTDSIKNPTCEEKLFAEEMKKIKSEKRDAENSADRNVNDMMWATAYPYSRLGVSSFGRLEDINATTKENIKKFEEIHYRPDRMTLIAVGDFDHKDIRNRAERALGDLKPHQGKPLPKVRPQRYVGGYKVEDTQKIPGVTFRVAFPISGREAGGVEYAKNVLLAETLAGKKSPFYELLDKKGIYYKGAAAFAELDAGNLVIQILCNTDQAKEIVRDITQAIKNVQRGITHKQFSQAKNLAIGNAEQKISAEDPISRIQRIAYELMVARESEPGMLPKMLEDISLKDLQEHAAAVFSKPPTVAAYGNGVSKVFPSYAQITKAIGYPREVGGNGLLRPPHKNRAHRFTAEEVNKAVSGALSSPKNAYPKAPDAVRRREPENMPQSSYEKHGKLLRALPPTVPVR